MSDGTNALAFEDLSEPPGVEVVDRIEQQRYAIQTPEAVDVQPASTDDFHFPVERAVEFETSELTLPTVVSAFVRDGNGEMVAEIDHRDKRTFPNGGHSVELSTQIKTYIEVETAFEISSKISGTTIRFAGPTTVRLGLRSRHEQPAASVTTTGDPRDVMAAIETFGSALKTTDPERSYPTLRGHPPAVELGDRLAIPSGLDAPETGISLELPLDLEHLYVASPLAYYLGASLEPGETPRIVTADGFEYDLDGPAGFQTTVGNALKQLFFLDCVTRTEGLYQVPLDERNRIEPLVDLDFATVYDRPLTEQVAAYLQVPFGIVEDHLPEWPLSTHVAPVPDTAELLPFVVDDLSVIATGTDSPARTAAPARTEQRPALGREDVLTRSASESSGMGDVEFVQPDPTDAIEQAWIGEDIPIGASKLTIEAFRNRLDRELTDGDIEIAIVVNDGRMDAERDIVDQVYGDREHLPFTVTEHRNTTTAELADLLGARRGFLHYIGHTERDGFVCSDGKLDAATLDSVGVDAFLLNACNSYNQGLHLIEAGAIGGIVTLADIINEEAVSIGQSVARLLNAGFPLRASLTIAREESIQGGQYIVVGDGGMAVAQADGRVPNLLKIRRENGEFSVEIRTYTTDDAAIGTMYIPYIESADTYHLGSGTIGEFSVSHEGLAKVFEMEDVPLRVDGNLLWSSGLTTEDL